jgi:hypothetical protein
MSQKPIDNYYNRFDPAKYYDRVLVRDGYGAQGSEINEIQDMQAYRLRGVADALFKDGDIVRGAQLVVNAQTGEARAEAGQVYLDGAVREVSAAVFSVPVAGSVAVGIRLTRQTVSELEDPALYNPAVGTETYGEPGAWRLKVTPAWGFDGDGAGGDFYPVHIVDDGVVRSRDAPPNLDSFNQGLARYDRDSTGGGTYIPGGLVVRAAGASAGGAQIYTVSEGRARVWGYGVELPTSRRLSYAASPDLRHIETEIATADGSESRRVDVAHAPIRAITMLKATLRKTVAMTHGGYTGAADALPDTGVVAIVKCWQGETDYVPTTDYVRTGDTVNWSPAGNEPAPGSTYSCTYDYLTNVEPVDPDYDGFSVEGAVAGSSILVSYNQALPRYDRLCLTQDGAFVWQRGVAAEYNARPPAAPEGVLALATVHQTWRGEARVINDGIRVMSFADLEAMTDQISALYQEISRQRLEADISTREAGARAGIFADPLINDEMRDQGLEQSAAIINGNLTLSVAPAISALAAPANAPSTAAYTPAVVLSQPLRTGDMQINPYMSFGILPARVTLAPAIDQWTDIETQWTSPVTQRLDINVYAPGAWDHGATYADASIAVSLVASTTRSLEYLRQISVGFELQGFGPAEVLQSVVFDGIDVDFEAAPADADGVLAGSFTIPEKVPAGAKTVTFRGNPDGGSWGSGVFIGQGQLTVQTLRQANTITYTHIDPLAQTFTLDATTQICGVDLWFTAKAGEVRIQIREVQNGVPTRVIMAEAVLRPEQIVVSGGGHTRALFPVLVQLLAGTEYAVAVLCNDPTTAVSIAEMGKFDATAQKWVASQPYTVGVLLSSSNASTWTAHQDKDLTFRLLEAGFVPGTTQINMGSAEVSGATDMVVLALEEAPTAVTRVEYELTLPDGNTLLMGGNQPVRLAAPITGAVAVKARLTGTAQAAPLLWPGAQLLAGAVSQSDDYYSRSIPATDATKAVLIYNAFIPSGATVTPEIRVDDGEWESLTQSGTVQQGDGVVEYAYEYELSEANLAKVRFTLTGTSAARPRVSLIRFMAIK